MSKNVVVCVFEDSLNRNKDTFLSTCCQRACLYNYRQVAWLAELLGNHKIAAVEETYLLSSCASGAWHNWLPYLASQRAGVSLSQMSIDALFKDLAWRNRAPLPYIWIGIIDKKGQQGWRFYATMFCRGVTIGGGDPRCLKMAILLDKFAKYSSN
jgi:hypothetical protein